MKTATEWFLVDLGRIDYRDAHACQLYLIEARLNRRLPENVILFCEHPPVFTLGRRGGRHNLLVSEKFLTKQSIELIPVERGGDITFHGPGQLVVYLVMDLRADAYDLPRIVGGLESVMLKTARDFGIHAVRDKRNAGIWMKDKKLGSIGLAIRQGVSFHGIALNVNVDLKPFQWIHPCGLTDVAVTSLAAEIKAPICMTAVKKSVQRHLQAFFDASLTPVTLSYLYQKINQ